MNPKLHHQQRKLTSEQMTLQMFRVEVCLVAVWTRELPVRVFCGNHALCYLPIALNGWVWSSRRAGENTTPALRTDHVCWSLLILHKRCLLSNLTHLSSRGKTWQTIGNSSSTRRHWADRWETDGRVDRWHRSCGRRRVHHRLRQMSVWVRGVGRR
jgi:hypothetical protein